MSDHRERACYECGSLLHHEDDCPGDWRGEFHRPVHHDVGESRPARSVKVPRTRTDVVDRGREWLAGGGSRYIDPTPSSSPGMVESAALLIRDLLAEVEALRARVAKLEEALRGCRAMAEDQHAMHRREGVRDLAVTGRLDGIIREARAALEESDG